MSTLVIIDMQWHFMTARPKWLIDNVLKQINIAKDNNWGIVVVEIEPGLYGYTMPRIRNAVEGYDNAVLITKELDDGSDEVRDAILSYGFDDNNIVVCGVNTSYCVFDTVEGLTYKFPQATIEIVKPACNCWKYSVATSWEKYKIFKPQVIVREELVKETCRENYAQSV